MKLIMMQLAVLREKESKLRLAVAQIDNEILRSDNVSGELIKEITQGTFH